MRFTLSATLVLLLTTAATADTATYRSHAPMRPLPQPSKRPAPESCFHADAVRGDDRNDGSAAKPWKTIAHAMTRLSPGDTLCLRGTFYETVTLKKSGAAGKPLTIRSQPGESAVIDGGLREFFEEPAKAWEPVEGQPGEFRSAKAYPNLGTVVLGHFGDSMVPLHGYRNLVDLRSENEYWNLDGKLDDRTGFYCGPGVWYDGKSGRLHARLAHNRLEALAADRYRGETDPRKLALVVAGPGVPLKLDGVKHVRIQDLVVRGGSRATIDVAGCEDVDLDGVTAYGGNPVLHLQGTTRLRVVSCALRGISAPWSSRAGHKYRGVAADLLVSRRENGPNRDVEIAHSELTDSHDGPYLGTVRGLKFHHNLVDNFNDDGIYLTAGGVGGDTHIYQNRVSRCLHAFSFAGKYEAGAGVWIYRNVIDLRRGVAYTWPKAADDPEFKPRKAGDSPRWPWAGRMCGDHGSPTWEPIRFYHNTVVTRDPAFRDYYAAGWGGHVNSSRSVFNNVFVQIEGNPGLNFGTTDDKLFEGDGNLLWGTGAAVKGDFFAKFRASDRFKASKKHYAPGWGTSDVFADPKFVRYADSWDVPFDPRPAEGSPAVDAGVSLPESWPDPLRKADRGKPDVGALPAGAEPFHAGLPVSK
jgi:hypothetical protein